MQVKLLLFSDLHLDASFAGFRPRRHVASLRRQALRDTLRNIVSLAAREEVDALLCGGDLYEHAAFTDDTMRFVRGIFAELNPVPVYIAPGNHDWPGKASLYERANWTPNVHVFESRGLTPVSLSDGLTLWGTAHCVPAGTPGFRDGLRVDWDGMPLALFHGSECDRRRPRSDPPPRDGRQHPGLTARWQSDKAPMDRLATLDAGSGQRSSRSGRTGV